MRVSDQGPCFTDTLVGVGGTVPIVRDIGTDGELSPEAQDHTRDQAKRLREADEFCVQANLQYGSAGQGLCDAAMDQAVGEVSGKPSAYDLCHAGNVGACEIAVGQMSVSDPRYDEVWSRIHRPYEFH